MFTLEIRESRHWKAAAYEYLAAVVACEAASSNMIMIYCYRVGPHPRLGAGRMYKYDICGVTLIAC